jgi:hypothetical protein
MVNEALSLELQNGVHALSIVVSYTKKKKKTIKIHVWTICDLQEIQLILFVYV